jgi:broad specificity phosphatase PhoE
MDTIAPWLAEFGNGVSVQSEPRIIEPNYGLWSGRKLEELALESLWNEVQHNPAQVIFPNGEKFVDVWERVHQFFAHLKEIASEDGTFIVVSHGDIIKFLIANILNIEFKNFQSLVVEPGSISIAQFAEGNARLLQYNRSEQDINSFVGNLWWRTTSRYKACVSSMTFPSQSVLSRELLGCQGSAHFIYRR